MQTLITTESRETLTERQRTALLSLLVDDDPAIYKIVRSKILSFGQVACEWLQPQMLSSDPLMRRRPLAIVHHLARKACDGRLLAFCLHNGQEFSLELA